MICVTDLVKRYHTRYGEVTILDHINLQVERGEKVGIIGRNGSGKSTLIRLLGGADRPTSGSITRTMTVSWPLAFSGGFQGTLTGLDNLKFICRIYGTSIEDKIPFVEEFSELGRYFREPLKTYSSGMRARLAFAISMVIDFDCFLIDEIVAVGDFRFREKCRTELFEKRKDRSLIIVSHDIGNIKEHCSRFCVINHGKLYDFSDIDAAYNYYIDSL